MSYAYQATVTIPAASGSDQTNITVVLTGTDARLKTVANGGQIQHTVTRVGQTVPADLVLSSDAGATSLYNWGWDFYDPVNGVATIWVLIPTLSHTASTVIYVSIGNAAVSTYQGGAQGAEFDTNTKLVAHLPDGTSLNTKNFADAGNPYGDGALSGSPIAAGGKIDGGVSMTANSQKVQFASPGGSVTGLTVSVWMKVASSVAGDTVIFNMWGSFGGSETWLIYIPSGSTHASAYINNPSIGCVGTATVTDNVWHKLVWRWSTAATLYLFVDGVLDGSVGTNPTALGMGNPYTGPNIGAIFDVNDSFIGLVDEARIDHTFRSADWIATEYANQSSPPVIGVFSPISGGGILINPGMDGRMLPQIKGGMNG